MRLCPISPSRRYMTASFPVCALIPVALLFYPAAASGTVKVEKKAIVVEHKTFDPKSPPKEMPPLKGDEQAVTTSEYACDTNVQVSVVIRALPSGKSRVSYAVRSVTVSLGLKVVVWLPEGAPEKLKAHEEGHRQIAEKVYDAADAFAKKAAEKADGRRINAEAAIPADAETAANSQLSELNKLVNDAYAAQVIRPAERVQNIYDDLTAHGTRLDPDEKTAIRKAFEQEDEAARLAAKAAATRPATGPVKR